MAQPIIEIAGLSKKYQIGANRGKYLSLREELARTAHGVLRRFSSRHHHLPNTEDFWALKDVSFSVQEGEVVGIIGRNGAGKSTLLKILSQITPPTEGKITLRGRVSSLLEVGTGFHQELTGRENIFLNGAILGMRRDEIRRKFDQIVAFAEMEKFLDTQVKHYSSGMYVRLAFAVAAHLEPEILIIDEVLAVGDAQFQKKCLGKMDEVAKQGRTVLFVSHNMAALSNLCSRGVLIREGRLMFQGPIDEAVGLYLAQDYFGSTRFNLADRADRTGSGAIRLLSISLLDDQGKALGSVPCGGTCRIAFEYEMRTPSKYPQLAFTVRDHRGQCLSRPSSYDAGFDCELWQSRGILLCTLSKLPLIPGRYRLNTEIRAGGEVLDYLEGAYTLQVDEADFFGTGRLNPHSPVLFDQKWSLRPSPDVSSP